MWLPKKENSKLYFLLLDQHPTCNDVTIKLLLSPGPNHTSPLLLHQLLPMFPVVPGDWLARFHWQRHLTFTVIWNLWASASEHCSEKSNAATTGSGEIQKTMNWTVFTRSEASSTGVHKDLWPFLLVKYLRVLALWGIFAFSLVAKINSN